MFFYISKIIGYPINQMAWIFMLLPATVFIRKKNALYQWHLLIHEWIGFITYKTTEYIYEYYGNNNTLDYNRDFDF